jgi:hypothetical protein
MPSSELEAAELFTFPTTSDQSGAKALACIMDVRLTHGTRLASPAGNPSEPMASMMRDGKPGADLTHMAMIRGGRSSALPDPIPDMLAAARVLQQSTALAAAGSLPNNALLLSRVQQNLAFHISHCITAQDVYSMPRNELPVLWTALAAADACVTLMWSAPYSLKNGSPKAPGQSVWLQAEKVSKQTEVLCCHV